MRQQKIVANAGTFKVAVRATGDLYVYRNRTRLRVTHDERADTVYGAGEVWTGPLQQGDLIEVEADSIEWFLLLQI